AQGSFRFVGLTPGRYAMKAELEGFSTLEYPNVNVNFSRFTTAELTLSATVEDVITVTAEAPLLDERRISTGQTVVLDEGGSGGGWRRKAKKPATPAPDSSAYYDFDSFEETAKGLRQGLVGGVKPLNVAIPEAGKVLLLTGILPPAEVSVALDVKAAKNR
ncbi:MAG TPA: carboxypeptidase-like regulatory domain-containing protein, partial [Thermoanaerobaculia bacterium]|nr:carboxypeptidase-like regulatory domain-containing protein [Thermoanaerobaculia bacterium]